MASLRLDNDNARWLGVCAGIAQWLDVPAVMVRIVAIICIVAWPPLLIGYFVLYFIMDRQIQPDDVGRYFKNAKTAEHFRRLNYRKPVYKNERNKRIAGVCSGVADYLEISPFIVRALTLLSLFVFGPFTVMAYVICAVAFDPDPFAEPRGSRHGKRRRHRRRHRPHGVRKSYRNNGLHDEDEIEESTERFADGVEGRVGATLSELDERVDEMIDDVSSAMGNRNKTKAQKKSQRPEPGADRLQTAECYRSLELRLREIEAFMTSSKFRLHCELNRI